MRARARAYRDAFERAQRRLRGPLRQQGACRAPPPTGCSPRRASRCDVASGGELHLALGAGFDPARIFMHGNNKTDAELDRRSSRRRPPDARLLRRDRAARAAARRPPAAGPDPRHAGDQALDPRLRRRPASSTRSSASALADGLAARGVERVRAADGLELVGLHAHIGSQIFELEPYDAAIRALASWPATGAGGERRRRPRHRLHRARTSRRSIDDYAEVKVRGVAAVFATGCRILVRAGPLAGRQRRRHRSTRSARSRRSPGCAPTSPSTAACPTTCGRCSTAPRYEAVIADRAGDATDTCRRSPACTASPATS